MNTNSEKILEVKNLTVPFLLEGREVSIVDDLSFDLYPGKTLAIVGESGSGKSTLALALVGALPEPPALKPRGQALYKGKNLLDLSRRELNKIRGSKITMIFQDPNASLNPVFTIGDQLEEVIDLHMDLDEDEAYERIIHALREVKLKDPEIILDKYPHQLSGGQKQRVMIAMAILVKPDILIADEPTTALDATIQMEILNLIAELQKTHHMATMLITHDMGVVAEIADDVMVMYASQSFEIGKKQAILEKPAHPYTQALIATLPSRNKDLKPIKGAIPSPLAKPSGCIYHPRCPFKWEACERKKVELYTVKENHQARCLLYDPTESKKS